MQYHQRCFDLSGNVCACACACVRVRVCCVCVEQECVLSKPAEVVGERRLTASRRRGQAD